MEFLGNAGCAATHQDALGTTLGIENDFHAVPSINTYEPPSPWGRSRGSRGTGSEVLGITLDLGRGTIAERRVKALEVVEAHVLPQVAP